MTQRHKINFDHKRVSQAKAITFLKSAWHCYDYQAPAENES